jgi:glycosyltransferase involved in cell wall biosynthesis
VHILPPTTDLPRCYVAADAFVFPTAYDAFGMVLLEAMASGLPVFTSERAGASELITSGKDGFVIPLDDWVEATIAGLRDRGSLQAIGREAEQTARQHDWSTVVRKVEQVYLKVSGCVAGNASEIANPTDMSLGRTVAPSEPHSLVSE